MSDPALDPPAVPPSGVAALSRRIVAFAGVPFLALLAPFIFLPVLSRLAGVDAWVAIALGQSVGGLAALVAGVGYATLAPPAVARADSDIQRRILATSVHVPTPIGVFRDVQRPEYAEETQRQLAVAQERSGPDDLKKLLHSGATWVVN